jgi:hypothetical protein
MLYVSNIAYFVYTVEYFASEESDERVERFSCQFGLTHST